MTVEVGAIEPGITFAGDFRVAQRLASGGMGTVYVAEQISTGKLRALKVMQPELVADPGNRQRFALEARAAAAIDSDHVVEVVGAGVDDATAIPWLAMELLDGEDLAAHVARQGSLPAPAAREVFCQLGHGLMAAHRAGLVHRDLKPDNVFLARARRDGVPFTVKLLDFGVAKLISGAQGSRTIPVGTPLWMAPEQTELRGVIGPHTDVWALGLLAFYALTGRSYWLSADGNAGAMTMMRELLLEPLAEASERARALGVAPSALPPRFDAWFARCVAREPGARFPSACEAVPALLSVLAPCDGGEVATAAPTRAQVAPPPSPASVPPTRAASPPYAPTVPCAAPQVGARQPERAVDPLPLHPVPWRLPAVALAFGAVIAALGLLGTRARDRRAAPVPAARAAATPRAPAPAAAIVPPPAPPAALPATAPSPAPPPPHRSQRGASAAQPLRPASVDRIASRLSSARLRRGYATVVGLLAPEAVDRVVVANFAQLDACVALGAARGDAGLIVLRFQVASSGAVTDSRVARSPVGARTIVTCMAAAVRTWRFPPPELGGTARVEYHMIIEREP